MPFQILSADSDAQRWTGLVEGLDAKHRDIHYLPDYGRIYARSYGFAPLLALYEEPQGYVLQPFVRRALRDLAFLKDSNGANFTDIANPYGYGGPLCSAGDPGAARELYGRFAGAFALWCDDERIASEFASLHPFMVHDQLALIQPDLKPDYQKDVVYIDLRQSEDELLRGLRKGHRSSIALARRSEVRVEPVAPSAANLDKFNALYHATMVRNDAAQRWFLPSEYFDTTMECLGPERSTLFFALVDGKVESGCLVMHAFSTGYYHFAATSAEHRNLGVNNLMVFETALWLKGRGYERYHLGGGVTNREDDMLLRFKAGFSPLRAPLYTYFCVRDRAVYDELCDRKRVHEIATAGRESESGLLPLYRR